MSTSTVSASVDTTTKDIANTYIRQAGLTPNQVIRNLWEHIARTGEVPMSDEADSRMRMRIEAFEKGNALAAAVPADNPLSTMSDADIEEMIRDRDH